MMHKILLRCGPLFVAAACITVSLPVAINVEIKNLKELVFISYLCNLNLLIL